MGQEARWFVVHTYSGYENRVKEDLEKSIENLGMQDTVLEVKYPTEEAIEVTATGKKKVVQRKVYPGYVMVKILVDTVEKERSDGGVSVEWVMNPRTWYVIRNTRGVTGFVGPGSKPTPLSDQEVAALAVEQVEKVELAYQVGDTVEIKRGLMEGNRGVVQSISEDQKIITVLVNRGRRDMAFEVSADDVGRVAQ